MFVFISFGEFVQICRCRVLLGSCCQCFLQVRETCLKDDFSGPHEVWPHTRPCLCCSFHNIYNKIKLLEDIFYNIILLLFSTDNDKKNIHPEHAYTHSHSHTKSKIIFVYTLLVIISPFCLINAPLCLYVSFVHQFFLSARSRFMFKVVWENKNDGILDVCVTWGRYYNANVVIKVLLLLPMTKKKEVKTDRNVSNLCWNGCLEMLSLLKFRRWVL